MIDAIPCNKCNSIFELKAVEKHWQLFLYYQCPKCGEIKEVSLRKNEGLVSMGIIEPQKCDCGKILKIKAVHEGIYYLQCKCGKIKQDIANE